MVGLREKILGPDAQGCSSLSRLFGRAMIDVVRAQDISSPRWEPICTSMISTGTLPGVFEAVPLRGEDVNALVPAHELFTLADNNAGGSLYDDLALGAMMVHLHREHAAGLHMQQLDLKTRSNVQGFEVSPRPVVSEVLPLLLAVRRFSLGFVQYQSHGLG